jgi:hypothetical protein
VKLLKDEQENDGSPGVLTVLPAFGSKMRESTITTEAEPSELVTSARTVSWAETASRGKSWEQPTLFTKFELTTELFKLVIL